jgi:DNA-binding CsgD family transcriptional regulator/PAS domain-containing protein
MSPAGNRVLHFRMPSEDALAHLLNLIYDAATDELLWPMALERVADALSGTVTGINLLEYRNSDRPVASGFLVRMEPEYRRRYGEYYAAKDVWIKRVRSMRQEGAGTVKVSEELLGLDVLERTEFYNDYLLPQGTVHQIGGVIAQDQGWFAGFTCLRARSAGPFGEADVALLKFLLPHFRRALEFRRKLRLCQQEVSASHEAMDSLSIGVIILDRSGKVLFANKSAVGLMEAGDGITGAAGGLSCSLSDDARDLRRAVEQTLSLANGSALSASEHLRIRRRGSKRPLCAVVSPSSCASFRGDLEEARAVVFISDPERSVGSGGKLLCQVYGFSRAEARLASLLIEGESLTQSAARLGITHHTVRSQIKQLYEKTDTHHQSELVSLLLRSLAAAI